jgi:hypothetical protein
MDFGGFSAGLFYYLLRLPDDFLHLVYILSGRGKSVELFFLPLV